MKIEFLQFQIDQLRKDKMIYALESCAISLATMVFLLISVALGTRFPFLASVSLILGIFALGYALYMGVGNFKRLQKIKELEAELGV